MCWTSSTATSCLVSRPPHFLYPSSSAASGHRAIALSTRRHPCRSYTRFCAAATRSAILCFSSFALLHRSRHSHLALRSSPQTSLSALSPRASSSTSSAAAERSPSPSVSSRSSVRFVSATAFRQLGFFRPCQLWICLLLPSFSSALSVSSPAFSFLHLRRLPAAHRPVQFRVSLLHRSRVPLRSSAGPCHD